MDPIYGLGPEARDAWGVDHIPSHFGKLNIVWPPPQHFYPPWQVYEQLFFASREAALFVLVENKLKGRVVPVLVHFRFILASSYSPSTS